MPTRLGELRDLVGGELVGNPDLLIAGTAILSHCQPGQITLLDQASRIRDLHATVAAAAVVPQEVDAGALPALRVRDVHEAFAQIVMHFRPPRQLRKVGVSPRAVVSPTAQLEAGVEVHPGATIGDDVTIGRGSVIHTGVRIMAGCQISEHVTIFPNAVLYEDTRVGPRSIIHAGAIIGAYGFGYRQSQGRHVLSAQLGFVEIGADVDVGAGTTIDRGTYGPTTIGEGTKIDNQVMIGHNCRIGRHNLLCSQVGIAGSSSSGDYVVMAGQVGISDHVHVGDRAVLCAQTGISNDVADEAVLFGYPGLPLSQSRRCATIYARLPEMRQQLREMQKSLDALKQTQAGVQRHAA